MGRVRVEVPITVKLTMPHVRLILMGLKALEKELTTHTGKQGAEERVELGELTAWLIEQAKGAKEGVKCYG